MCGICGYIDYKAFIEDSTLSEMVSSIRHRGPNDCGIFFSEIPNGKVALGHTRLSILDLSTAAHQPMSFSNLTIVFNGEVYNYKEIREELVTKGHHFVSNSDTEVVLHAYKEWGSQCVTHFVGMFAFAIFDAENQRISLCRDRAGIKPLYYYWADGIFAFGSELKCLMAMPQFKREINEYSLSSFLKIGYISGESCIFENTKKVDAGCWVIYDLTLQSLQKVKYWDIESFYIKPKLKISYEDAKCELKRLFISAFGYRLISDVPVGVLLSGGFDSAAVVSILTKELGVTPSTFTIGFSDYIDEAPDADIISRLLNTNQTTHYCKQDDIKEIIPLLPLVYDEPFSDTSALPTIMISKVVKNHVSVVLSGDGGDEMFAGYYSNDKIGRLYNALIKIPPCFRKPFYPKMIMALTGNKFSKVNQLLDHLEGIFEKGEINYKSLFDNRSIFFQNAFNYIRPICANYDYRIIFEPINTIIDSPEYGLLSDWKTTMKDEYLVKMDRATMSQSLEGREPMLDHRIAEFVAQLPWEYKYNNGIKKRILKDIVYDYLPKSLMDKPKRGFSPPVMKWMRGSLKDYVCDNLSEKKLQETGFDYQRTSNILDKFMKGDNYYYSVIWRILQFQCWYQYWVK